jgi:intracellular septation protein
MADEPGAAPKAPRKPSSGWLNLLVDYGPLLVFFSVYWFYAPSNKEDAIGTLSAVIHSTSAFVLAAIAALVFSKVKLGRISPMLWLSTGLIVVFGGVTIWSGEPWVIQFKPTVVYLICGIALIVGWLRGKALLQWLLEAAFEGLDEEGWIKLSRNWGFFFFFLAALNEVLRHTLSFGDWLTAKLWVFMPLSFLFTFTQLPMLLRHGLAAQAEDEVVENPPPE